jgi:DNA-binding response OmpR family regulator
MIYTYRQIGAKQLGNNNMTLQELPATLSTNPNEKTQILIAEDDDALRHLLNIALKRDGYRVLAVRDGKEALSAFADHVIDLVLLDINMPIIDGYEVCLELRKRTDVPIIMITAKSRTDEVVTGFQLGADYYMTKPFSMQELRARIQSMLRRRTTGESQRKAATIVAFADISLDEENRQVTVRGEVIGLTPNEFRVLSYLMRHPDKLISKEEFLSAVWDYQSMEDTNFVRVTIRRLRSKIELDPSNPSYLRTIHGEGYQFYTK